VGNIFAGLAALFLGPDTGVLPVEESIYYSLAGQVVIAFFNAQSYIFLIPLYTDFLESRF
jgi:hypothetical protein